MIKNLRNLLFYFPNCFLFDNLLSLKELFPVLSHKNTQEEDLVTKFTMVTNIRLNTCIITESELKIKKQCKHLPLWAVEKL